MDTLTQEQIEAALGELDGWGFDGEALTRTFRFADFVRAIDFVEHLAEVAEEQQHHPDIDIRYNKVTLRLSQPRRRRRHACATWSSRRPSSTSRDGGRAGPLREPRARAAPPCYNRATVPS